VLSFASVVFLCKFHVTEELGIHPFGTNMLTSLRLFDTIRVSFARVVVRTCVLRLKLQKKGYSM
jgi:hypothetical protein